jgi:hypothetical protein
MDSGDEPFPRTPPGQEPRRDPKAELCSLVRCVVGEKVLGDEARARFKELGVDLEALRACIKEWCAETDAPRDPAPAPGRFSALNLARIEPLLLALGDEIARMREPCDQEGGARAEATSGVACFRQNSRSFGKITVFLPGGSPCLRRSKPPVGRRSNLISDQGGLGATVSALNPPNPLSAGAPFSTCPHAGQVSMSMPNTRFRRCAPVIAARRSLA